MRSAPGSSPASLVFYDVSTLYFETDTGDGFREPGFSKERRLDPQITIGLLTGFDGFPLMVSAFEVSKAETRTMLPVVEKFMAAHRRCTGHRAPRGPARMRPAAVTGEGAQAAALPHA
jgi:hypothetical protein